ncbi:MAG: hypothetical protein ABI912_03715 [Actinomycetota bacterium]
MSNVVPPATAVASDVSTTNVPDLGPGSAAQEAAVAAAEAIAAEAAADIAAEALVTAGEMVKVASTAAAAAANRALRTAEAAEDVAAVAAADVVHEADVVAEAMVKAALAAAKAADRARRTVAGAITAEAAAEIAAEAAATANAMVTAATAAADKAAVRARQTAEAAANTAARAAAAVAAEAAAVAAAMVIAASTAAAKAAVRAGHTAAEAVSAAAAAAIAQDAPTSGLNTDGSRRGSVGKQERHSTAGWAAVLHEYVMPKLANVGLDPMVSGFGSDAPAEMRLFRDIAMTTGHAATAEALLSQIPAPEQKDLFAAAQGHALLAIAQELVWLNTLLSAAGQDGAAKT